MTAAIPAEYETELLTYGLEKDTMNETTEAQLKKLETLREPFPASAISQLPKGGALLDFVGHANVTDRLLSADPLWTWEPFSLDERGLPAMDYDAQSKPVGLWIKLTVCGVTRPGYGTCLPTKGDAVKELIGDALRNASMRFGVALDLWAKADLESQTGDDSTPRTQPQQSPQQRAPQSPQNAPERTQNAPDGNAPSDPQKKAMYAIACKLYGSENAGAELTARFGEAEQLTRQSASAAIKQLQEFEAAQNSA